jgi:hypothetical protein
MAGTLRPAEESAPQRGSRVLIAVPPGGFGGQWALMQAWLNHYCGCAGWSCAPAGTAGVVNDAVAFYFADRQAACAFVERFGCGYRAQPPRVRQ